MPQSSSEPPSKRRTSQGEKTYQAILQVAMNVASVEGLDGLTISRLAKELGMSKSGLFAHFGSKEELQLATINAARSLVRREVFRPAIKAGTGIYRLWALCESWLSYIEQRFFRGGCFFAATSVEFSSRPGPIRDRLAVIMQERLYTIELLIKEAQRSQEIQAIDSAQLAFELDTLIMGANWAFQLHNDPQVIERAKTAILHRLQSVATADAPPLPLPYPIFHK